MQKKKCTKCGINKYFNEFHKLASGRDGLNPVCKKCHCEINLIYARTKDGLITSIYSHQQKSYQLKSILKT